MPATIAASMRMPSAAIGEPDAHDAAYPGHRWHAVMQTIVAAARANGLRCMDGPYAGYTDAAGLDAPAGSRWRWASTASSAFIRRSSPPSTTIFAPSDEEVTRAAAVVRRLRCGRRRRAGRGHARGPDDRRRQPPHGAHHPRAPTAHRIVKPPSPNGFERSERLERFDDPNDRLAARRHRGRRRRAGGRRAVCQPPARRPRRARHQDRAAWQSATSRAGTTAPSRAWPVTSSGSTVRRNR